AEAAAWFHDNLLKTEISQEARKYLKGRGISLEIAKSWLLGYAPDSRETFLEFLRGRRFSNEEIVLGGLASAASEEQNTSGSRSGQRLYARFRGRIMFPIRNDYGEVIGFSGRLLDPTAKTAKYVNSPETLLFTKGRVLYGLDKSKRALIEANAALVCEGQLDLISAFEAGVQNVIAPQGTAFTLEQARLLRRFVETVILCFDSDRAGQQAIGRSMPALLECGLEVRIASLPEGEDPDSFVRAQGADALRKIVAEAPSFFHHALQRLEQKGTLAEPAGKSSAAKRLGPYVAAIRDPVLRETTARMICARLGITEAAFATHIKEPAAESEVVETDNQIRSLSLSEGIRHLCRLCIIDPEVKAWLAQHSSPPPRELGEGGDLLEKIVQSPLAIHQAPARAAFVANLTPQEELTINMLDLNRSIDNAPLVARHNWFGLAAAFYKNRRSQDEAQLHKPNLSAIERTRLQIRVAEATKQILDLQCCLNEF
ncbi:MAG TPA: toprim domain-containing protein, partial [Terrimicrobiaceae bacterium]